MSNSILNSPYEEPGEHWKLDGYFRATDERVEGRRASGAYLPVPKSRNAPVSLLDGEPAVNSVPYSRVNRIREEVGAWREAGYPGVSGVVGDVLEYWRRGDLDERPFFCQREAVETLMWLWGEGRESDVMRELGECNEKYNEGVMRLAVKMATGTGKTQVMAMVMVWLAFMRGRETRFLLVAPNLTVRDRLAADLDPRKSKALYEKLVPQEHHGKLGWLRVEVRNFQAFQLRNDVRSVDGEDDKPSGVVKRALQRGGGGDEAHRETSAEMLERVLGRDFRGGGEIFVLNDEAHHCRVSVGEGVGGLTKEEKASNREAAVWFGVLRSMSDLGWLAEPVFDFSATPMYLKRPAGLETEVFPWVVSDYPLIEAVEAGLTKVPRVPVDDDTDRVQPVYRDVYGRHKEAKIEKLQHLGLADTPIGRLLGELYQHYGREVEGAYAGAKLPPVFIVVANNITNATEIYKYIAGWQDGEGEWHHGMLDAFSNVEGKMRGRVKRKPPTLLVHSALDEGEVGAAEGKALEMYGRIHVPGEGKVSKKDILGRVRDIFNAVGKKGGAGAHIRCVVSVGMLTEGWDTRTVTHILGYRAFTSQLLCEQVAGRALRRTAFPSARSDALLEPEYANIFGVPFSFIRAEGESAPSVPVEPYEVYAEPKKRERRIVFPNVVAYRMRGGVPLVFNADAVGEYNISASRGAGTSGAGGTPTRTRVAGMVGEELELEHGDDDLKGSVDYRLAARVHKSYSELLPHADRQAMFRNILGVVRQWLAHPLVKCDNEVLLTMGEHIRPAVEEVLRVCVESNPEHKLLPVFADERDATASRNRSTADVYFTTTVEPVHDPAERSELNVAPCDSEPERRIAAFLDTHPRVAAWVRNFRLGWSVPWLDRVGGRWRWYEPDFVVRVEEGRRVGHLLVEYKGRRDETSVAKREAVERWWLPAVRNSDEPSCGGVWGFCEIVSPEEIESHLQEVLVR